MMLEHRFAGQYKKHEGTENTGLEVLIQMCLKTTIWRGLVEELGSQENMEGTHTHANIQQHWEHSEGETQGNLLGTWPKL